MSLAGLTRTKGSVATIRRGTKAVNSTDADGTYNTNWADLATDLPLLLHQIDADKAQRIWGRETRATYLGIVTDTDLAIQEDDGVIITGGFRLDQHFRVEAVRRHVLGPKQQQLALVLTQEDF